METGELVFAQNKAVTFLLKARSGDGFWRDFKTLAGASDEWVTGYVASALACSDHALGMDLARSALSCLMRRRIFLPGWGYNRFVPPDADSTSWVLVLAQSIGTPPVWKWRLRRAKKFLDGHISRAGGIVTYANPVAIRMFTRLSSKVEFSGWCMPHTCVTAAGAAIHQPRQPDVLEFLRASQAENGTWSSYWWREHEYATALATEALCTSGEPLDRERCRRAALWAEARLRTTPPSPFTAALSLRIILAGGKHASPQMMSLLDFLISSQQADGGWQASAHLRIPPPDTVDPDNYGYWQEGAGGGGSIQVDRQRLFTTATVLVAISRILMQG